MSLAISYADVTPPNTVVWLAPASTDDAAISPLRSFHCFLKYSVSLLSLIHFPSPMGITNKPRLYSIKSLHLWRLSFQNNKRTAHRIGEDKFLDEFRGFIKAL